MAVRALLKGGPRDGDFLAMPKLEPYIIQMHGFSKPTSFYVKDSSIFPDVSVETVIYTLSTGLLGPQVEDGAYVFYTTPSK